MSEKRFKVAVYDENAINGFAVLDLHKPNISKRLKYENVYIGSKEGCEIVCNFGNGLADENKQLKQREKTLEGMIRTFDEGCKEIYDDKCRLEKENEQLKYGIDEMGGRLQGLWANYYANRYSIWAESVEDVANELGFTIHKPLDVPISNSDSKKERINGVKKIGEVLCENEALKKENEQLKKELKRCKNWINSDKYDYELTLAFIKSRGYSLKDVLEYEKELNMK